MISLNIRWAATQNPWQNWGIHFDLASKTLRIEELEREMEAPGYWDNVEKSQEGMKELNILKEEKQKYESLEQQYEDI